MSDGEGEEYEKGTKPRPEPTVMGCDMNDALLLYNKRNISLRKCWELRDDVNGKDFFQNLSISIT